MTAESKHVDGESWQIITGEKEFHGVQGYLRDVGISNNGFDYNVVAVFGSQSTGKSTLLNQLFGTRFATMDTISRQQTTKGIWISRATQSNILVMDVEGTDGRERGDDQDFERKSALFSIATSEVLVVNLWETQVGLYNGANMGLLKTVFEVNLQIFQNNSTKKERSLLLFVIRDHLGTTPLDNLAETIESDLTKIWNTLQKPLGAEQSGISDYFDFAFVGLPHKVLQPDAFDAEVGKLRRRFLTTNEPDSVFKPEYHKRIPVDGFSVYADGVWQAIEANKDLDLPSQQQLLAQFRCDEILAQALSHFDDCLESIESNMRAGIVLENLGSKMADALSGTLAIYDTDASRYHNSVYDKKRVELMSTVEAKLLNLYRAQLLAKKKQVTHEFENGVSKVIQESKSYEFVQLTEDTRLKLTNEFKDEAEACCVTPMVWNYSEDLQSLEDDMTSIISKLRSEEVKKLHDRSYKKLKVSMDESVSTEFSRLDNTVWDRVLSKAVDTELGAVLSDFSDKLHRLGLQDDEAIKARNALQQRAWKFLRAKVVDETSESRLLLRLREHFEDNFKFDNEGTPIVWRASDDIDGKYRAARERTLAMIPVLGRIEKSDGSLLKTPEFDEEDLDQDSIVQILSSGKQAELTARFKRIADSIYVDAKRSTVSSVASVPLYFYGLLLVLGWNELMALLRNPLYFVTIIFVALILYGIYFLNLSGPVEQIARSMFGTFFDIVKEKLRSALEVSQESVPELLHSSGNHNRPIRESIELDDMTKVNKKHD